LPNGVGKASYCEDFVYEGQWVQGRRHGNGVQTWEDGSRYEGEWVNDRMHGNGKMTL